MLNYEKRIKLKFKLIASFYDLFDLPFRLNPEKDPRRALAGRIPDERLRILDVCVGTANSAIAVAEAAPSSEIVGIDLSPHMIAVANGKIKRKGLGNIEMHRMDATRMDFRDGEFDAAMVSFALHEMDHGLMTVVLREIGRVTKPDGFLYIIDYEKQETLGKNLIFSVFLKLFEPGHLPDFLRYDWPEILRPAGFEVASMESHLFSKLITAVKRDGSR